MYVLQSNLILIYKWNFEYGKYLGLKGIHYFLGLIIFCQYSISKKTKQFEMTV